MAVEDMLLRVVLSTYHTKNVFLDDQYGDDTQTDVHFGYCLPQNDVEFSI